MRSLSPKHVLTWPRLAESGGLSSSNINKGCVMHLIQFEDNNGKRRVGRVEGSAIHAICDTESTRQLALDAIAANVSLSHEVARRGTDAKFDYDLLLQEGKVLPPVDHDDPAHCIIAGTGLTHLGSAEARSKMHEKVAGSEENLTDTMRLFKWGLADGKPVPGKVGLQPEWFYKGDGTNVVRPGGSYQIPDFATDHGEEPEVVGIYVIGPNGTPYRLGYAVGNECTDHVMEKKNYLYLAHSKMRACSYGPELFVGELPRHVDGVAVIKRGGELLWQKPFITGEDNMSHTLANIEYHHFKYDQFVRPGDVHVQFFGTAVASFNDGVSVTEGDSFEISIPVLGRPLVNPVERSKADTTRRSVKAL